MADDDPTTASGIPLRPVYGPDDLDPARAAAFLAEAGNDRQREEIVLTPEGEVHSLPLTIEPACAPAYRQTGCRENTRWVAVLSDGVHSFVQTHAIEDRLVTTSILLHAVLRELLAFKNLNGAFVQRRMQRFLPYCEAHGWQHRDDIAVGVVEMGMRR